MAEGCQTNSKSSESTTKPIERPQEEEDKVAGTLNHLSLNKQEKKRVDLKAALELQQIDEILEYLQGIAPGSIPPEVTDFLQKFDKENAYSHTHPEMVKHINFVKWVKSHGSITTHTKLVVYAKDYRGLHATANIALHEDILLVPIDMTVSSTCLERTALGQKLTANHTFDSKWISYMFPLIYFLDELQNPASPIRAWIEVIPKTASDHPMFFTEDEKKWLQSSPTLRKMIF